MPGNRHDAQMWAQLGPLSHCQCERPVLRKNMKLQPSADTYLTLPPFGMPIALEVDENKLLTWNTWFLAIDRGARGSKPEESIMWKLMGVISLCLAAVPAFSQSTSKYQVATIMEVKAHNAARESASDVTCYDVSVRVGNTIYVVLYTPPLGENNVEYFGGRELLVLVGKKTITYNDILGQSFEAPIESQKPATQPKVSK
jgi:hypothetical protein